MLDLTQFGTSNVRDLHKHDLLRIITDRVPGIKNSALLLNAFTQIDRKHFVPEDQQDLAYRDRLLTTGYGEVLTNPSIVAQILWLLQPQYGKRYLHLGTGTGYLTTLLGHIVGQGGMVHSLERIQWLWEQARVAAGSYLPDPNLKILYRDAAAGLAEKAPYDGIIVSFIFPQRPVHLYDQLARGGKLIYPTIGHELHVAELDSGGNIWEETIPDVNSMAFGSMKEGVA